MLSTIRLRTQLIAALITISVSVTTACWTTAGELTIGTAESVITPTLSSPMAGYFFDRYAEGVHDDLMVKAVVFHKADAKIVLVGCDLISMPKGIADKAKDRISQRCGIPESHVIISATHAHTGPKLDDNYSHWVAEKIADTVQIACSRTVPARIAFGVGEETRLPFHRRFWMKDGTLRTNPGKLNPDIVKAAGGIDPSVPVLLMTRPAGKPLAVVVNYALHLDTVGGTLISADAPHFLSSTLRGALQPELLTLYTTGACGNINHWDVTKADPQRSLAEAKRIGVMLAGEVLKVSTFAECVDVDRVGGLMDDIDLPLKTFTEDELKEAREIVKIPNPPGVDFVLERVWALRALEVTDRNASTISASIQALCLGDVAFVAVPCELFYELGLDIKRQSPFPHTMVIELANDNIGYVPRREDYENGGYEVVNSRLAPGGGEQIVAAALDLLRRLRQQ